MENQELHDEIDRAINNKQWPLAYELCERLTKSINPDDSAAKLKGARALFEMGRYNDAFSGWLMPTCMDLLDELGTSPTSEDTALYTEARALSLLCQLQSVGCSLPSVSVQTLDLIHRVEGWFQKGLLSPDVGLELFRHLRQRIVI